jgi:probable phosphoglycerate mutase
MRLVCVRCALRFTGATLKTRYVAWQCCGLIAWHLGRYMEPTTTPPEQSPNGAKPKQPEQEKRPPRLLFLVRHGQTTFNVEGRLPGQMEGVALTDEGRRQAYRAAVSLSGVPLSAVVSSPLERALDTAKAIAKGGGLDVHLEPDLMDTDVGRWTGMKIDDVKKSDPAWTAFVEHPDQPPEGVESLAQVQARAVAVVERILANPALGTCVAVVAHADIVKVILAHYMGIHLDTTLRHMYIGNASISALVFHEDEKTPTTLAVNWSPAPDWLAPRPKAPAPTAHRIEGEVTAEDATSEPPTTAGETATNETPTPTGEQPQP